MSKSKRPQTVRDHRHQFAALPWRMTAAGPEFLLITSRETRRWVAPKGWPMRKKSAAEAAAQEAFEEAGVRGVMTAEPIGSFSYLKRLKNDRIQPCIVDVYPLEVREELQDWPEASERDRRWMKPVDASIAVDEPELSALIDAFAYQLVSARKAL